MKSIKEGPFQMGTVSDVITGGTEGAVQQGPVRARVLNDLSAEEKERYKADIRATNILLQGIPKDIYSLINHYTDAKDIWENVKMILEGSELTKDDRESQMQLNSKFVNNMLPEWSRFITEVKLNRGLKESNCDQLYAYLKQHEVHANENRIMMERFCQPNNDPLALVSDASVQHWEVGGDRTEEALLILVKRKNPSSLQYKYHEVHEMQTEEQHNYVVDSYTDYTSNSNTIPYDQYMEDNEDSCCSRGCIFVRNDALMSILDEMHEQGVQSRLTNKPDMVMNDSVTSKLARYKELVGEYEKRAKFELTDRERKIDEQMRIIISDRNRKETSLKSELHSAPNTP
ncbi:hypothetical protein Tco_0493629 [Tanacetum coccineum]